MTVTGLMSKPVIIVPDTKGITNASDYAVRLDKSKTYRDLSTVIICPTRGTIPARIVQSWQGMMRPMNQMVIGPIFMIGMEVAEAYNQALRMILESPDMKKFKFLLTIEEDNACEPDSLLKLYESIDEFDAVGGLYWTKGVGGMPMCYGSPTEKPFNFRPQNPIPGMITECNGLGQGFTLFRLKMFQDKGFKYGEWFKTEQSFEHGVGAKSYTQDLKFFEKASQLGYKFGCDARVPIGHYDLETDTMW